jgi:hypothetical protein
MAVTFAARAQGITSTTWWRGSAGTWPEAGRVVDTLRASRSLEAKGFTREQAEGIAEAIGDIGLAGVRRDVDVLKWMVGAMVVIMVAVFWQSFALNGTVTRLDERTGSFGDRMNMVESRLTGVETRLASIEAGQAALKDQPSVAQGRAESRP